MRIVQAVRDVQAHLAGKDRAQFFADDFTARTVRKACELDMIRLANDVEESGIDLRLAERARLGLFRIRNIAAHGYAAMDEQSLWVALNDLQLVLEAAEAAEEDDAATS